VSSVRVWPGIPRRDWVSRTRTENTTPARVRMRVLIDGPGFGASVMQLEPLARSQPRWAELKRTSVTAQAAGPAACWPDARAVGHARSDRGNQAGAHHRRGRLRVLPSRRELPAGEDARLSKEQRHLAPRRVPAAARIRPTQQRAAGPARPETAAFVSSSSVSTIAPARRPEGAPGRTRAEAPACRGEAGAGVGFVTVWVWSARAVCGCGELTSRAVACA
jgi:hypothetical protein